MKSQLGSKYLLQSKITNKFSLLICAILLSDPKFPSHCILQKSQTNRDDPKICVFHYISEVPGILIAWYLPKSKQMSIGTQIYIYMPMPMHTQIHIFTQNSIKAQRLLVLLGFSSNISLQNSSCKIFIFFQLIFRSCFCNPCAITNNIKPVRNFELLPPRNSWTTLCLAEIKTMEATSPQWD